MSAPPDSQRKVLVHLPAQLRDRTGQQSSFEAPAGAVRDIISALDETFPGLRFNLCTEEGELRPFVNIFVDGRNVRYASLLDTPAPEGCAVHILHSVAGG